MGFLNYVSDKRYVLLLYGVKGQKLLSTSSTDEMRNVDRNTIDDAHSWIQRLTNFTLMKDKNIRQLLFHIIVKVINP